MDSTPSLGNTIIGIFYSSKENRLRAGWRILLQTVLFGVFLCVMSFPVGWFGPGKSQIWVMFFFTLTQCFAVTVSVIYARRFLDKRSFASLGLSIGKQASVDFLFGIGISAIMLGLIFFVSLALGWVEFDSYAWQSDSLATFTIQSIVWVLIFVMSGWQEELLFRGYQLQNMKDGINLPAGIILSSAIFASLHLVNQGASFAATLGVFLAGVFLAFSYTLTGQLWLPIGLHIGWNTFEGVIFGFPVSGLDAYSILQIRTTGPELWVGGPFGPESGLILLPGLLAGGCLVYFYSKRIRAQYDRSINNDTAG